MISKQQRSKFGVIGIRNQIGIWAVLFVCCLNAACNSSKYVNRQHVSEKVYQSYGHALAQDKVPGSLDLPPDVNLTDGLSEEEAVSLALWNNTQFQSDLVELQIASADVTTARLIQNPL